MTYGIGRVPGDVDPTSEMMAELDATRLTSEQRNQDVVARGYRQLHLAGQPTATEILERFGREAILERARGIHSANPDTLGHLHFEWLIGHAVLELTVREKTETPGWVFAWDSPIPDEEPIFQLARLLAPDRIPARNTDPPELLTCPVCGQTGYPGAYPFSTGYGDGRCDDCG